MQRELIPLTNNVWLWPWDPDKNRVSPAVGVIVAGDETILVDSGNCPTQGRHIQTAVSRQNLPPISRIIYTHHHWDHVFGAQVFGVPATAHALTHENLLAYRERPWTTAYIRDQVERNPALTLDAAPEDWETLALVLPAATFTRSLTLPLNGLTLELTHVGGAHANDSIVVQVVEDGVLFLGDCYYPRFGSENKMLDFALLRRLADEKIRFYVSGHSPVYSHTQMKRLIRSENLLRQLQTPRDDERQ